MNAQEPQAQCHMREVLLPLLAADNSVFFDPFARTPDTAPLLREILLALVKSMPKKSQIRFRATELKRPGQHFPHPAVEMLCGSRFQAMLFEQVSPDLPVRRRILRMFHARNRHAPSPVTAEEKYSRKLIGYCEWRAKRDGVLLPNHRATRFGDHSVRIEVSSLALDFSTLPESGVTIDGALLEPVIIPAVTKKDYVHSGGRYRFYETVTVPEQRFAVYTLPKRITDYDPDNALISASFDGEPEIPGAAIIGYVRGTSEEGTMIPA